jgi:hypothetical protein
MSTFTELLFKEYGSDAAKVKCIVAYLKLDTEFVERFNYIANEELQIMLDDAANHCSYSIITTPLVLGVIVSIVSLVVVIISVLIGRVVRK